MSQQTHDFGLGTGPPQGEGWESLAFLCMPDIFTSGLKERKERGRPSLLRSTALTEHFLNAKPGAMSCVHIVLLDGH